MSDRRLRSPTLYPIELRALTLEDRQNRAGSVGHAHENPTTPHQGFDPCSGSADARKLNALAAAIALPISDLDPRPLLGWALIVALIVFAIVWLVTQLIWLHRHEQRLAPPACGHPAARWYFAGDPPELRCEQCEARQ